MNRCRTIFFARSGRTVSSGSIMRKPFVSFLTRCEIFRGPWIEFCYCQGKFSQWLIQFHFFHFTRSSENLLLYSFIFALTFTQARSTETYRFSSFLYSNSNFFSPLYFPSFILKTSKLTVPFPLEKKRSSYSRHGSLPPAPRHWHHASRPRTRRRRRCRCVHLHRGVREGAPALHPTRLEARRRYPHQFGPIRIRGQRMGGGEVHDERAGRGSCGGSVKGGGIGKKGPRGQTTKARLPFYRDNFTCHFQMHMNLYLGGGLSFFHDLIASSLDKCNHHL